jgi:hypothetical protein
MNDPERLELISFLARNPTAGDRIPGTGGARKVRWARAGEGKSGGFRVIYYFYSPTVPLFALNIFAKNEQANLTQAEKNELKAVLGELVDLYQQGVHHHARRRQ